ncbi:pyrimidine dimer DNA glycosylase/endonuclease V [Isoptericola sp. 4D.3]|uniref:Pyrimidine dimer DNA glycosylase/endonuclease V n=1 Tax=Isoptericola peretonis TaxID=2918523 RepID=A0ABT0J4N6_9MICO|nr:pyrimidine dimer DNA glycosylase/endonuclease V [Isoptericola sp. 4D.3]
MRLWSLAPDYLDRQGLTACWREALLAQAVLAGRTRGYRNHSQLVRFRATPDPLATVGAYLDGVADEATARSYHFDRGRILEPPRDDRPPVPRVPVTEGQVATERDHLLAKLRVRSPARVTALADAGTIRVHPLFTVVPGPREDWERA